jgi:CrcB protein
VPGQWPLATFAVNVAGCFVIGALYVLIVLRSANEEPLRLFWMTGVLGGFTTYSAFALETTLLATQGVALRAAAYALATLVACIAAAAAGRAVAHAFQAG